MVAILSSGVSTAREAALRVLNHLEVTDPPLTPSVVLAGLGLTQHMLPAFDLDRLTRAQRRQFSSVRGLLSPADRKIYLSADLAPRQEPWIIYHESGHAVIEVHRKLLYLDTTHTLSPAAMAWMETEANEFAGDLLFFGDRLTTDARDLPFGIASALKLATHYEASIEATLRRYILTSSERCVCNAFQIIPLCAGLRTLKFHYFTRPTNQRDRWDFGRSIGQALPLDDPLVSLLNRGLLDDGTIQYETRIDFNTGVAYFEQILSTGLAVFVVVQALSSGQ